MGMPELELDTVWKSEDDMSSENPTSSQPPSDEQQETGNSELKNLENPENPVKKPDTIKTNSVETVPMIPPPPSSLGPCLVPPSLAQAKKAMKPLLSDEKICKTEQNKGTISLGQVM